ncbi:hypothetical protein ZHAS_00011739 [Anopheles sinensis]|uniref:Uncharacterized protein n=1 Tax=Anopheles sinensis TaxID=74873 RepID=A0A084W121_ANOSI|nr:hypothetical protein ZHAS_00011739 [Anopheles sinensis]
MCPCRFSFDGAIGCADIFLSLNSKKSSAKGGKHKKGRKGKKTTVPAVPQPPPPLPPLESSPSSPPSSTPSLPLASSAHAHLVSPSTSLAQSSSESSSLRRNMSTAAAQQLSGSASESRTHGVSLGPDSSVPVENGFSRTMPCAPTATIGSPAVPSLATSNTPAGTVMEAFATGPGAAVGSGNALLDDETDPIVSMKSASSEGQTHRQTDCLQQQQAPQQDQLPPSAVNRSTSGGRQQRKPSGISSCLQSPKTDFAMSENNQSRV